MKILLLTMPHGDLTQPYTAVPSLTAHLRARGHEVEPRDCGIEFAHYWLEPHRLATLFDGYQRGVSTMEGTVSTASDWREYVYARSLQAGIEPSLETLPAKLDRLRDRALLSDLDQLTSLLPYLGAYSRLLPMAEQLSLPGRAPFTRLSRQDALNALGAPPPLHSDFLADVVLPDFRRCSPDIVGLSVTYPRQLYPTLLACAAIKSVQPEAPIVLGGAYLSTVLETLLENPETQCWWDFAVDGEGETALDALLSILGGGGGDLAGVPNLVSHRGGAIHRSTHSRVENLESLETPDYASLDLSRYFTPAPVFLLPVTRGCYMNCAFCSMSYSSPEYRFRGAAQVARDLQTIQTTVGAEDARHFDLAVDTIAPPHLKAVAEAFLDLRPQASWSAELRFDSVRDPDIIPLLRQSGCRQLRFGLESAAQRVLSLMNKRVELDLVERTLETCTSADIKTVVCVMFGFPGESAEDAAETVRFVDENRDRVWCALVHVFGLARDSAVALQPRLFGISTNTRKDRFIQPHLKVTSASGITHEEAQDLAQGLRARLRHRSPVPHAFTGSAIPVLLSSEWTWRELAQHNQQMRVPRGSTSTPIGGQAVPTISGPAARFWSGLRFEEGTVTRSDKPMAYVILGSGKTLRLDGAAARFIMAVDGNSSLRELSQVVFGRTSRACETALESLAADLTRRSLISWLEADPQRAGSDPG